MSRNAFEVLKSSPKCNAFKKKISEVIKRTLSVDDTANIASLKIKIYYIKEKIYHNFNLVNFNLQYGHILCLWHIRQF